VRVESALHLLGRALAALGLLALLAVAAYASLATADPARLAALLLGAGACLSLGWGLRLACEFTAGALGPRATRAALAAGSLLAALLALAPLLLAAASARR